MSFSYSAARNYMPLLGRLVLAAAFIPIGWNKMMGGEVTYEGNDARILRQLGIGAGEAETARADTAPAGVLAMDGGRQVETGNLVDRLAIDPPDGGAADPEPANDPDPAPEPEPEPEPAASVAGSAAVAADPPSGSTDGEVVRAKTMYRDAIAMTEAGIGPPKLPSWFTVWTARIIAFVQLVGAGLLLAGLLARVWAVMLALVIGFGFYLSSWSVLGSLGLEPMAAADFNAFFASLCLLMLSLGITMTGAGVFSLDGMFFHPDDMDLEDEALLGMP